MSPLDGERADSPDAFDAIDAIDATPRRASGAYGIVVVPMALTARHCSPPAIVYFHGMWASPEDSCSYFERAVVTEGLGSLVCPRGNAPAAAGGAWTGTLADKRRSLDDALVVARGLAPAVAFANDGATIDGTHTGTPVGTPMGTLMGFSSGAALALELAIAEPGRFSGLVLMSMTLAIAPAKLKSAGVRRIVFAAGELDGSYPSMLAASKATSAAGIETRFMSLGKVGHHFAVDMEAKMVDAVAWVRGTDGADCVSGLRP